MSSTISLPLTPTSAWVRNSLIGGSVFLVCWAIAIAYWRNTHSNPGSGELAACLFALPLALSLAACFCARLILPRIAAPAALEPAKPALAPAAPPPTPSLAILAAALRSPHGASIEELATALEQNRARPGLDKELIDDDGFPVMTARSSDARDDALQEEMLAWLAANGMPALTFTEAQWRALTLASGVATDLALRATAELMPADGAWPMLQLLPILPPEWPLDQRRAAGLWLGHIVAQAGWPSACLVTPAEPLATASDAVPSAVFGRISQEAQRKGTPLAAFVIACASRVGQETVDQWAADGTLFTSSRPQGRVPGEGAVGLLVTDVPQARSIENAKFVVLEPLEEGRLAASADEGKRVDPAILEELSRRVVKRGNVQFKDVVTIVADTGHRMNRTLELMGYASVAMPHLDDIRHIVRLGVAYGNCGTVPFMTALALALARHYALQRFGSILCVGNEDPYLRLAALVQSDDWAV